MSKVIKTPVTEKLGIKYPIFQGGMAWIVNAEMVAAVPPTCTTDGTIEHWKCSHCGEKFADEDCKTSVTDVTDPALGHTFGEWETVTKPTAEKEGEEKRTCTKCGYEETKTVSALHMADTSKWLTDKDSHWHACATPDCTEIFDKAEIGRAHV